MAPDVPRLVSDAAAAHAVDRDRVAAFVAELREGLGIAAGPAIEAEAAALAGVSLGSLPLPQPAGAGIGGRREILARIAEARRAAARSGCEVGVIAVVVVPREALEQGDDVIGDRIAGRLARALRTSGRSGGLPDAIGRWDASTFCALVADVPGAHELVSVGRRLHGVIARSPVGLDGGLRVRLSSAVGAVVDDDRDRPPEALVERALRAARAGLATGDAEVRLAEREVDDEDEAMRLAFALAHIASFKEAKPLLHDIQVSDLAAATARELGLPPDVVRRCRIGGVVHDVGKVVIPDRIHGKPGALDAEEYATMKQHAEAGSLIIGRMPLLACAVAAVRHHHERWDGAGYPAGLRGAEIPIEARIVATADAYSAITTERVYQPERSREAAIAELRRSAGSHLDPDVVEALVAALDRLDRAIRPLLGEGSAPRPRSAAGD